MFCLQNTNYELCRSHSKKNVLLKFLGKKMDGALNEFVPNFVPNSVSSINDLLRKIDKTGSVERKVGSGRPRSIRTQRNISRVYSYAVKRTILVSAKVLAKSKKLLAYRVHFTIVYRALP